MIEINNGELNILDVVRAKLEITAKRETPGEYWRMLRFEVPMSKSVSLNAYLESKLDTEQNFTVKVLDDTTNAIMGPYITGGKIERLETDFLTDTYVVTFSGTIVHPA